MSDPAEGRGPKRVGELVDAVLDRAGVRKQVRRTEILDEWDEIVGEGIARVTRAVKVSDRALFVEVRSSAWLQELEMMKHELMTRLNAGRGDGRIEKLVFVLAEKRRNP